MEKKKRNRITPYVTLSCSECKIEFSKKARLYNFWSKRGQTEFYCSNKCQNLARTKKAVPARQNYEKNFWKKVDKTPGYGPNGDCWKWVGMVNTIHGYGYMIINKHNVRAHRFSWELHNNRKIEDGKIILHSCDIKDCVNPEHLIEGTHKENSQDCIKKDRRPTILRKLDENKVKKIRDLSREGITMKELAAMFDVVHTTIERIVYRKTWKSVD